MVQVPQMFFNTEFKYHNSAKVKMHTKLRSLWIRKKDGHPWL